MNELSYKIDLNTIEMNTSMFSKSKKLLNITKSMRANYIENKTNYKTIEVQEIGKNQAIGLVRLNKPRSFNTINEELMTELANAVKKYERDLSIKCIIITGSQRSFSIGADIKEMRQMDFSKIYNSKFTENWNIITKARKPIIGAVNGYALGGGCELAMMCDIIIAGEKAEFGQPEIIIGTIPGAGGTQRLTRIVGKSKAMEMVLTGNRINAKEAQMYGLVSSIHPVDKLLEEATKLAETIASHSKIAIQLAKESVNSAYETTLEHGISHEKKLFYASFATRDRKEGMSAFVEKRKPKFTDS
jgi:enoyl-CoA hydratase